jgi:hypothetical protein
MSETSGARAAPEANASQPGSGDKASSSERNDNHPTADLEHPTSSPLTPLSGDVNMEGMGDNDEEATGRQDASPMIQDEETPDDQG